jgi:ubiquinone/menaquinone biosynthesis C-methylase UbiE
MITSGGNPMKFLDLKDISERYMEVINPSTPEKMLTIGKYAGLKPGSRVIDFGCGFGEALALWAEQFGVSGIGIDIRPYACERARQKMATHGLADRIEIVCGNAAAYPFEPHAFDVAACIGATFIWDSYQPAIRQMKDAIRPSGKLIVGEAYWRRAEVPPDYARDQQSVYTERQLLRLTHEEGFDFEYVARASHDDWDRYEAGNWHGLIRWIEENPDHPERQQVIDHLHQSQEEYLRYAREYFGWAMYVLNPMRYR